MRVEQPSGIYKEIRIPGIVATEKGTLLRYCECRKSSSDWADIDIKISRSEDEGVTWDTALLIEGRDNTMNNPVMFVDGSKLILLFCKNYKEMWKCISTDDGRNFSAEERVNFEDGINFFYNAVAPGPGHGIKHNDRLIVPIWFAYNKEDHYAHGPSFISTLYSDDHGERWKIGEAIYKDELVNPSECALAVTANDEILISIRHEGSERTRALAKSPDGISKWHGLRYENNLTDPVCMGGMVHRNGTIYHINCDSPSERENLTLKISNDCFESVRQIAISDVGGYSDIAFLNNKIFVFYEKILCTPKWQGRPEYEPLSLYFDVIEL